VSQEDQLLQNEAFMQMLNSEVDFEPSIAFAGQPSGMGLHIMAGDPAGWTELLTGLGAAGCDLFLSLSDANGWPQNGHLMVPLVQVGLDESAAVDRDWDRVLSSDQNSWLEEILSLLEASRKGQYLPLAVQQNNVDFQITRGAYGISL
jgi:hypothetical protein